MLRRKRYYDNALGMMMDEVTVANNEYVQRQVKTQDELIAISYGEQCRQEVEGGVGGLYVAAQRVVTKSLQLPQL